VAHNELNHPVEDGSDDADENSRIDGIVEQVRQDIAIGNADDATALLRQRLDNAGIGFTEAELERLTARVSEGA
jgi:hypothetical protein